MVRPVKVGLSTAPARNFGQPPPAPDRYNPQSFSHSPPRPRVTPPDPSTPNPWALFDEALRYDKVGDVYTAVKLLKKAIFMN